MDWARPEACLTIAKRRLAERLRCVNVQLEGKTWLMGDTLTLAGGHLFIVSNWAPRGGVGPSDEEHRLARREHLAKRPAVQTALQTQGLLG